MPLGQGRITLPHTPHVEGSDTSTCQAVMIYCFTGDEAPADEVRGSTCSSDELLLLECSLSPHVSLLSAVCVRAVLPVRPDAGDPPLLSLRPPSVQPLVFFHFFPQKKKKKKKKKKGKRKKKKTSSASLACRLQS